jgi:hypothetical protein
MEKRAMFTRYTLVLLIGLFAVSYAFADYYKYRDQDGVLRFTDNLGEVPADQRPKVERYHETKPVPKTDTKDNRNGRKKANAQATSGQSRNKTQTEAQWLIREQRDLDAIYKKLMNEKMTLVYDSQQIQTPEEAKTYRRKLKDLNERIAQFEKRRYKYLHRASILKDEIEKGKQRQSP